MYSSKSLLKYTTVEFRGGGVIFKNFPLLGLEWREALLTPGEEESLIIQ